jgi:hypothetical protein
MRLKSPSHCLAAALMALAGGDASALGQDLNHAVGAVAGIAGSIYGHELGHALAFQLLGATDVSIQVPGDQCRLLCGATHARLSRPLTADERRWTSAAGLLSANLLGEALLDRRSLGRSGFGQGYVAANLYSNLFHVYHYYTRRVGVDGYEGNDLDQFEAAGGNPHLLAAGLLGYSLYSVKRLHDRKIPLLFVHLRF